MPSGRSRRSHVQALEGNHSRRYRAQRCHRRRHLGGGFPRLGGRTGQGLVERDRAIASAYRQACRYVRYLRAESPRHARHAGFCRYGGVTFVGNPWWILSYTIRTGFQRFGQETSPWLLHLLLVTSALFNFQDFATRHEERRVEVRQSLMRFPSKPNLLFVGQPRSVVTSTPASC